jgi:hypothetical protein
MSPSSPIRTSPHGKGRLKSNGGKVKYHLLTNHEHDDKSGELFDRWPTALSVLQFQIFAYFVVSDRFEMFHSIVKRCPL